ncbi:Heat shock 70 kDa protein D [Toxocara canis]|uniref:Heat shock 70 kDa protein D n=1 Tax=Toxocara canis TaxID=6265 RepID=A0A0B2UWQ1_TOXCA|nr:Heat shock 70 kDa protein D [Toxocara canis]
MSSTVSVIGTAVLTVLLAGYFAQKYGLPPPPPKIAGIDLGTTFSSIGIYQAVTGVTEIVADARGKLSIPSVIAFLANGTILIGTAAVEQQERNPLRTIYDTKRKITPEEVGGIIIDYLRKAAEKKYRVPIKQAVISVPAEFDQTQRNATGLAVEKAGMEVRRVISEPTAAALAYGLHKKKGVDYILVVDLGGGTLDVSLLWLQGGIFVTLAMAGNNRLGGQDFNNRVQMHLIEKISQSFGSRLEDKEDIQQLRMAIETAKIQLTTFPSTDIDLNLRSMGRFRYRLTRAEFELLNEDLFESIVDPIEAALADADIGPGDVDEIVLVGGSTRIPRVRRVVGSYFGKAANHGIDPELAVVTGASVQAGVIGGGWPLQVAAMELPAQRRKHHVYTRTKKVNLPSDAPTA